MQDMNKTGVSSGERVLGEESSAWPTVIGVLSLFYALLGLVTNGCTMLMVPFQETLFRVGGMDGVEVPRQIALATMIGGGLGLFAVVVLIIAAMSLLRRGRRAIRWIQIWVVLQVLIAIQGVVVGYLLLDVNIELQQSIMEEVARKTENASIPTPSNEEMRASAIGNLVMLTGVSMIFPVVIGLLMTRKTWLKEARSWGSEAS